MRRAKVAGRIEKDHLMLDFHTRPMRIVTLTVVAAVLVPEVWQHDSAILPSDGVQSHVPAEGPAPSGAPIGGSLQIAVASAAANLSVISIASAGYTAGHSVVSQFESIKIETA
jgi:hypothetical protein